MSLIKIIQRGKFGFRAPADLSEELRNLASEAKRQGVYGRMIVRHETIAGWIRRKVSKS